MWLVAAILSSSTADPPLPIENMKDRERMRNCTQTGRD